ncbi:hypothetical protein [Cryobacterium tepidiphilum]|uniref:DUF7847 domain-containing protein n=1 Tax=Cryobacterium tepidiphilum TaxID=2486026 RepID=A0A3M8KWF8_9MICO|nr:hypothetical protein [Cryobacterium tepidiphilum]RNE56792.1 hypothetical protein EEJ31_12790 [Cryobacterium tepidiphilum]
MTDAQNWQPPGGDPEAGRGTPRYGEYAAPTPPPAPVPGAPGAWAPPPKPGLIPLRPLGFGTLLWAPFQVLRRNPKATFGSALLVQGAVMLSTLVVVGVVTFVVLGRLANAPDDQRDTLEAGSIAAIILSALVPIALSIIGAALLQGIIVVEVARSTLGEKLTLRGLWRSARGRLWTLVLWTLLLTLALVVAVAVAAGVVAVLVVLGGAWQVVAIVVGVLAVIGLLVLGAWLFTRLSLVPSLIVLERLGIGPAARRSWSLTIGYFWRTLGVQFLVAVIVNVISQIVTTPLSLLFGFAVSLVDPNAALDSYLPSIILYVLILFVALIMGAIAAVVQSATTALIYIDLRMRKEGLDLELARFVESASFRTGAETTVPNPYLT